MQSGKEISSCLLSFVFLDSKRETLAMKGWMCFCDKNARGQHLQCLKVANHRAFAREVSMEEIGLCGGM